MGGIVCAIRGGPDCQCTVAQAITLAQETNLPLHFLYVVNLDFLSCASSSHVHTISEKMHQMGKAVLLAVQAKAAALDVAAGAVVREGNVGNEIIGLCRDLSADYVIPGCPGVHREESIFTKNLLKKLSKRIEGKTGAQVVLIESRGA